MTSVEQREMIKRGVAQALQLAFGEDDTPEVQRMRQLVERLRFLEERGERHGRRKEPH